MTRTYTHYHCAIRLAPGKYTHDERKYKTLAGAEKRGRQLSLENPGQTVWVYGAWVEPPINEFGWHQPMSEIVAHYVSGKRRKGHAAVSG